MNKFQVLAARIFRITVRPATEGTQQLLQSWRSILQILMKLDGTLPSSAPELALGIVEARGQILRLKTCLRQAGVDIVDLADELVVANAPEVEHQLKLLALHRRNLGVLLEQEQNYGAHAAPLHVVNSITSERSEIAQIKRRLRTWQAPVTDQQNDDE